MFGISVYHYDYVIKQSTAIDVRISFIQFSSEFSDTAACTDSHSGAHDGYFSVLPFKSSNLVRIAQSVDVR